MEQATRQPCTKPAGFPLDPLELGGCILNRGHDGPCGFKFGNGVLTIDRVEGPPPPAMLEEAGRYLRLCRRNYRASSVATIVSIASSLYLLWSALERMAG